MVVPPKNSQASLLKFLFPVSPVLKKIEIVSNLDETNLLAGIVYHSETIFRVDF